MCKWNAQLAHAVAIESVPAVHWIVLNFNVGTRHEVHRAQASVVTSSVLTLDLMFSENFLMSDVLGTNLMLTGLLVLFTTFPLILG